MKLLLAEDDIRLGNLLTYKLSKEYHLVDWVQNGRDAYDYAMNGNYDLLILDWMMPEMSGIEVCSKIRQKGVMKPILLLTAKDGLNDIVTGLDAGADDYIVKPFEFHELFARIRAVTRRSPLPYQHHLLRFGDLELDTSSHTLKKGNEIILLTKKEYQLLEILMKNVGQVLPRELLIEKIWGLDSDVNENSLDALVKLLRKKIDPTGKRNGVRTVRGVGYKLEGKLDA